MTTGVSAGQTQVHPSTGCSLPDFRAVRDRLNYYSGDGDAEFAREILVQFLENARELIARILVTLRTGDMEGVRQATHSLKSSSQIVGADELSRACAELESQAGSGSIEDVSAAARRIEVLFAVFRCSAEILLRSM